MQHTLKHLVQPQSGNVPELMHQRHQRTRADLTKKRKSKKITCACTKSPFRDGALIESVRLETSVDRARAGNTPVRVALQSGAGVL
jgi:hypothetical protein